MLHRKTALGLLTACLVAFGIVFLYFLFVPEGPRVYSDDSDVQRIWIENPLAHSITGVRVRDSGGNFQLELGTLAPKEKKSADLGSFAPGVPVIVESAFHVPVRYVLGAGVPVCPFAFTIIHAPASVRVHEPARIQLQACNTSEIDLVLTAQTQTNAAILGPPMDAKTTNLTPGQCTSVIAPFEPAAVGTGQIQVRLSCGRGHASVPFTKTIVVTE